MPTSKGDAYTLATVIVPPAMPAGDFELWKIYRDTVDPQADLYFNVRVGPHAPYPGSTPANLATMWEDLTRRRIDLVIDSDTTTTVVELHVGSGPSAVGRLLGYMADLTADNPFRHDPTGELVTDRDDDTARRLCDTLNLKFTVLPL